LVKRLRLQELTEQDRLRKKAQTELRYQTEPKEASENLITQFFNRPQHQAFAYRHKQDLIQQAISPIILSAKEQQARRSMIIGEHRDTFSNPAERLAKRREQELQVKCFQDKQVEEHAMARTRDQLINREFNRTMQTQFNSYVQEEKLKREAKKQKMLKNQEELKRQIEMRSQMWQFIGDNVARSVSQQQ